jgi:hypothetical protein
VKTIAIRLNKPDVSRGMAQMRSWLDQHGYAPSRFDWEQRGDKVVFSVVFMIDAEADEFAARFQSDGIQLEPDDYGCSSVR